MIIKRVWAMPNHRTFEIKPINKFIKENLGLDYIDPFPYPFKEDAIEFLKGIKTNSINSLVFDPPYSQYQLKEKYKNLGIYFHNSNDNDQNRRITKYWSNCKKEITRIIKPNGKVISFGWNSGGMGKKNGFEIQKILLVNHGSQHNDTICTLETKATSEPVPQES